MSHRIALLIHALYGGGAEKLMSQLATRWSEEHEVHLLTWSTVDTDTYSVPASVHRVGLGLMQQSRGVVGGLLANMHRIRALRRQLSQIRPEFVMSFSDQMNIVSLAATRPLGVPHWISEHSNPDKQRLSRLWEQARAYLYPKCSGCHVLNNQIAEVMQQWMPREQIEVIPAAVDIMASEMANAQASESPQWLEALADRPAVVFVGRLSREKGPDLLLQAWKQVSAQFPDWQLVIAGDGPMREQLQSAYQAEASIHFIGWVDDPWMVYRAAQLFVLPSRYEGCPVALLEAMSVGCAAVATECCEEVLALSDAAALKAVSTEHVEQLAQAIVELAGEPERRAVLGRTAQAAAQRYSWQTVGPRWDAILARCLGA